MSIITKRMMESFEPESFVVLYQSIVISIVYIIKVTLRVYLSRPLSHSHHWWCGKYIKGFCNIAGAR